MSDYEHTVTIIATAETIFAYVADLGNLPDYLPETAMAHLPLGRPDIGGEHYFRADPQRHRMEWGSPALGYSGRLEINPYSGPEDLRSLVTVHLSLHGSAGRPKLSSDPNADYNRGILQALEDTLNRIQRAVEERNGTIERAVGTGADGRGAVEQ